MKLYGYWQSSATYRVRIALNLKGLVYETAPVDIRRAREQHAESYRALNPNARVPTLTLDDGTALTQSLAIIEWLEETFPSPPLLPADPLDRARCRALAGVVAADIQPVQGLGVLQRLKHELGASDEQIADWARHWMTRGFAALEEEAARLAVDGRRFAYGDEPGLFEAVLIPQLYNAKLWKTDFSPYPRLRALEAAALALPAFAAAAPERQPDAPKAS
jgi:maleylacetoacetate isomerase/maleylpyruvate isomerase